MCDVMRFKVYKLVAVFDGPHAHLNDDDVARVRQPDTPDRSRVDNVVSALIGSSVITNFSVLQRPRRLVLRQVRVMCDITVAKLCSR